MEWLEKQNLLLYFLQNFDFKIWFWARQITGTAEKRAPEPKTKEYAKVCAT